MTVEKLITKLSLLPPNMQVFIAERKTEFGYGLLNSCYVKKINFTEEPDGEVLATENVVILDEE